jgi:hypothetical protein
MANTYYIPNPFYLQWHDQGQLGGQWNGSRTNNDYYKLDEWSLAATPSEYTFYFTTKQSAAQTSTPQFEVFATMVDRGGAQDITYGAKIDPSAPASATALRFTPIGTQLEFTAGRVISDDPKIKISPTKTEPTCVLIWTGSDWLYSYDVDAPLSKYEKFDCSDPNAAITLGPGGAHTIFVTDQTADGSAHVCGVFYADSDAAPGSNVGLVQSQTALLDSRTTTPITINAPTDRDWQCSLKLFLEHRNNKCSVLRGR